jgi:hypothetical protein
VVGARASLARDRLRIPRDTQPLGLPDRTRGVHRSRWNVIHDVTPTTTDIDLMSRIYRNVNYNLSSYITYGVVDGVVRILNIFLDNLGRPKFLFDSGGQQSSVLARRMQRLRFHSR